MEGIMSKDFAEVQFDTRVSKVAKLMSEKNASCAIVFEREQPIGICTSKDLVVKVLARGSNPEDTEIRDVCSSPLKTLSHDAYIQDGLKLMVDTGLGHIVVEKDRKPIGILSSLACLSVSPVLPGEVITEPSEEVPVFCPNCGYPNYTKKRDDTCELCGTSLNGLFSIVATPELEENLNKGRNAGELEEWFKSNGVSLSENFTVEKEKEDKWAITDRESIYIAKKEGENLSIYKKR